MAFKAVREHFHSHDSQLLMNKDKIMKMTADF